MRQFTIKQFTEACGGTFRITVNGDQFSVEITLPLSTPSPAAETPATAESPQEA